MAAACASVAGLAELEAQPLRPLAAQAAVTAVTAVTGVLLLSSSKCRIVELSSRPSLHRSRRQTGKSHVLRVLEETSTRIKPGCADDFGLATCQVVYAF